MYNKCNYKIEEQFLWNNFQRWLKIRDEATRIFLTKRNGILTLPTKNPIYTRQHVLQNKLITAPKNAQNHS